MEFDTGARTDPHRANDEGWSDVPPFFDVYSGCFSIPPETGCHAKD
jgi:hypothetical protein